MDMIRGFIPQRTELNQFHNFNIDVGDPFALNLDGPFFQVSMAQLSQGQPPPHAHGVPPQAHQQPPQNVMVPPGPPPHHHGAPPAGMHHPHAGGAPGGGGPHPPHHQAAQQPPQQSGPGGVAPGTAPTAAAAPATYQKRRRTNAIQIIDPNTNAVINIHYCLLVSIRAISGGQLSILHFLLAICPYSNNLSYWRYFVLHNMRPASASLFSQVFV